MSDRIFTEQVGRLLRLERERAGLTQAALAFRAGTTQQYVSHVECGTSAPTTSLVARLFDALGWQLRLELEARDADLDEQIEAARARTNAAAAEGEGDGASVDGTELLLNDLTFLLRRFPDLPCLLDGELAAALQGVPLTARRFDLAMAEEDKPKLAEFVYSIPNCLRGPPAVRDRAG